MRSRLPFLICLIAAVTVLAACSSTTAVSSDDQTTASAGAADIDAAGDNASDSQQELSEDDRDSATADTGAADAAAEDDDDTVTGGETDATEGFGLGGAEQIESLVDDCQDDNDLACDILFQISAFNSDEERTAVTCGGRSDAEVSFCTAGIDAGADEFLFDPDSDGLDRVVEACEVDGNMTACDFLYYRSPIDSEFQEIGGTCGGRVNVAVPDCRSIIDE